jgi:hypothetical protein
MTNLSLAEYDTLAETPSPLTIVRLVHTDNGHTVLTGIPAHPGDTPAEFLLADVGPMLQVSTIGFANMALHPEHARALAAYLTNWADRSETGRA